MVKLHSELIKTQIDKLRDGEGHVIREVLFSEEETLGKTMLCAIQTVPPGCSIGVHAHDPDAEFFYVLSGTVRAIDDGVSTDLVAGDSNFSGAGGSHGVINVSDEDAVMLCIVMK